MDNLPRLSILLLTYKRTQMALRTINSTCENLKYPKELISFYVADDGSDVRSHYFEIKDAIQKNGFHILGSHNERMRREGYEKTHFSGLGWNKGLGICHQNSDFVLVLEDDWELEKPLEIEPYMKLLQDNPKVGICSFRILSAGADVHTIGYQGNMYLEYLRTTQYAYSGNPHIRHARYTKRYGWFAENVNPGGIELHQDDQYRLATGSDEESPRIWRPADISIWGGWAHIGNEKSWV